MVNKYEHGGLTWIDLESPTREEVRDIMETYNIHPLVAEELLVPSLKPKVDLYGDSIYLILHFPAFRHTHSEGNEQEIDFVIGKKFLITTHYDTIDPVHKFSKVFEVSSILGREEIGDHAGFIFFYLIRKLYRSIDHELEAMADSLKAVEENVFTGNEKAMVVELSKLSREQLHFKQALSLHRDVLESFAIASAKFFGEGFSYHAKDILNAYYRTAQMLTSNIEFLADLRETNNSLLSTKQNETMRVLTMISIIMLPLSLVTALFGISSSYIPFMNHPNAFFIVLSIVAASGFLLFAYFRARRWL